MSGLEAFFKSHKKKREIIEYVASNDFIDSNGKVIPWKIKPIKTKEATKIRADCTKIDTKSQNVDINAEKFNLELATACTIFPDLNDKELQDSYDVMGADNLLLELLDHDGDYQRYCQKVLSVCGYSSDNTLVEQAKN